MNQFQPVLTAMELAWSSRCRGSVVAAGEWTGELSDLPIDIMTHLVSTILAATG